MPSDRRGDDPDPDRREGTLAAAGAPRDPGMERTLRQASRFAKARQSASLPELRASMLEHLNAGARPALDELDDADRAQELVYRAWETGNPDRARALLEEALSADPRCVDALVWRAYDEAETPLEVIEALEHAVRAGEEALGAAFFEENRGHFWSIVETRPYMQARMLLAQHLVGTRRPKEGLAHYLELLELCSSDNLGVRYAAAGVALGIDEVDTALEVLGRYADEETARILWPRLLAMLLRERFDEAEALLKRARAANPHVEELILDPDARDPEPLGDDSAGDPSEAQVIAAELAHSWDCHSLAFDWLADAHHGASGARREEIVEALASRIDAPAPAWLAGLLEGSRRPTDALVARVKADGASALPWLLAVIEDDDLAHDELWDVAGAPALAALVVGRLGLDEAARPLARRCVAIEAEDPMETRTSEGVREALLALRRPAVDAALDILDDPPDGGIHVFSTLHEVLAGAEEKSDRIYRHLVGLLRQHVPWAAELLAQYGDERAIDLLRAILTRTPAKDPHGPGASLHVDNLCRAIERLGGRLTADEALKRDEADRLEAAEYEYDEDDDFFSPDDTPFLQEPPEPVEELARGKRPGRNDPCWCNSGKKYKRCHLRSDEAKEAT